MSTIGSQATVDSVVAQQGRGMAAHDKLVLDAAAAAEEEEYECVLHAMRIPTRHELEWLTRSQL